MIYPKGSQEPAAGIDKVWDVDGTRWVRRGGGWSVEGGDANPWPYPLTWAPLDDRKDPSVTHSPQVGALTKAVYFTELVSEGRERASVDIAIDLLDALALQGWRLIHD